jgi:hypothetical protein
LQVVVHKILQAHRVYIAASCKTCKGPQVAYQRSDSPFSWLQ